MTSNSGDKRLSAAHSAVAETLAAVGEATRAVAAAENFLGGAVGELNDLAKSHDALSARRSAELARALKLGSAGVDFSKATVAKDHTAMVEARNSVDVAKQAVAALELELAAATAAHEAAKLELDNAARAILVGEAEAVAASIIELESEILEKRVLLEGAVRSNGIGWGTQILLSPDARRVAIANANTPVSTRNSPEWHLCNLESERVRRRFADLVAAGA